MRYFEDFQEGESLELGQKTMNKEEIIRFAEEFDPQPFHLDEEAAKKSLFGKVAASGWHTASVFMRLYVDNVLNHSASLGAPGIEKLRWLKPVYPGDTLTAKYFIKNKRVSEKRPEVGIIYGEAQMFNQNGEQVLSFEGAGFIRVKPKEE